MDYVNLGPGKHLWDRIFTVAPLIVVGTKELDRYNFAPKHMATPVGFTDYFTFVCTPRHQTYENIQTEKEYTISFPLPDQILLTSLAALPRCEVMDKPGKPILESLSVFYGQSVSAPYLSDAYLCLGLSLNRIIDGFDGYSLIIGKIEEVLVQSNYLKTSDKDEQDQIYNAPLLCYIANGRFASIKKSFAFPFPKKFKR
jgi:flavin reductase (DIM6/NTAB) family NADH-FMN oxidoreductase RutF